MLFDISRGVRLRAVDHPLDFSLEVVKFNEKPLLIPRPEPDKNPGGKPWGKKFNEKPARMTPE